MHGIPEFTTLIAVDAEHLEELRISAETWRVNRPEIWRNPMLVVCDTNWGMESIFDWEDRLDFLDHPCLSVVPDIDCLPWNGRTRPSPPDVGQREKMLTAIVFAAFEVHTDWYLKLDADCLAAPAPTGRWIEPAWFESVDESGDDNSKCAFIAPRWSYSKPADVIQRLDDWGDTTPGVREHPRLDLPRQHGERMIRHPRMISYAMFGNTAWTQRMADLCGNRLPVPSQDTTLFYLAERRGDLYRLENFKQYGWRHVGSGKLAKLKAAAAEILSAGTSVNGQAIPAS